MAIAVPDLTTLDDDQVQQTLDFITQRVGEYAPTVQRKRGVIKEIVLQLEAVLGAAAAKVVEQVNTGSSLKLATEDPAGADPETIDRVISNFRVTRAPGGAAGGPVTVVISQLVPVTIPKGLVFEANGVRFAATSAFAARTTAGAVVSATDRLIRPVSGGDYAFTIDVAALTEGAAGQLKRGARLAPQSLIQSFVRSYAEADFVGGTDADTTEELLAKLQAGLADRSSSNRTTIDSMIKNAPDFAGVLATSAIGYGDPEQVRYHYLFPVAFGGRVDVYAQTQALPRSLKLTKTATLVEVTSEGGLWQFSLARDEAPGAYEVSKIVPAGEDDGAQTGYEVREALRGFDLTADGTGLTPDVETAEEAAYSRFSTLTVRFLDTDTATAALLAGESRQDYDVVVSVMPLVAELQDFLADRGNRPAACDVLAKAPVPCFLELNLTVYKRAGQDDPDLGALRTDLADYVNRRGFAGRLSAGALAAVAHGRILDGQTVSAIDMFGRIVRPDGQTVYVRSDETLLIPDQPDKMVTARTTVFLLDPANVGVTTTVV